MKRIDKVVFAGLGAVGSAFFAKVCDNISPEAARAVAYGERARRYEEKGLTHNGKKYAVALAGADDTPAELLFIAVKNTQLGEAISDAAKFVGPDTVIIAPLNGVSSEKILGERFGEEKVLYSYAMIDAERSGDGFVSKGAERITFGDAEIYECYRALLNTVAPNGKTSMFQDIEAGRMTEVDAFAGTVVALAKKHDIAVPVNSMFLQMIRAKEEIFAINRAVERG